MHWVWDAAAFLAGYLVADWRMVSAKRARSSDEGFREHCRRLGIKADYESERE